MQNNLVIILNYLACFSITDAVTDDVTIRLQKDGSATFDGEILSGVIDNATNYTRTQNGSFIVNNIFMHIFFSQV